MNPKQFFNPNESEVGIIRIENSVLIILINSLGLKTSFAFIRIGSVGSSWIESD